MTDTAVLQFDDPGARTFATILTWPHTLGRTAHCLARLVLRAAPAVPVAILSELANNPDSRGISGDMPGVATAFLDRLGGYARLDPDQVLWIAHHGPFSSVDDDGSNETYTRVELTWTGSAYTGDLRGQHLLTPTQVADLTGPLNLRPVADVLAELRAAGN